MLNPELIALIQAKFTRFGSDIWYAWDVGSLLKPLEEMKEGVAEGEKDGNIEGKGENEVKEVNRKEKDGGKREEKKGKRNKKEIWKKNEKTLEDEEKKKMDEEINDLEREMEVFDEDFVRLCGYYSEDGGGLIVESRRIQEELMNNLTVMQSKKKLFPFHYDLSTVFFFFICLVNLKGNHQFPSIFLHPSIDKYPSLIKRTSSYLEYEAMRLWASKQSQMTEKAIYNCYLLDENEKEIKEIVKIYENLLTSTIKISF